MELVRSLSQAKLHFAVLAYSTTYGGHLLKEIQMAYDTPCATPLWTRTHVLRLAYDAGECQVPDIEAELQASRIVSWTQIANSGSQAARCLHLDVLRTAWHVKFQGQQRKGTGPSPFAVLTPQTPMSGGNVRATGMERAPLQALQDMEVIALLPGDPQERQWMDTYTNLVDTQVKDVLTAADEIMNQSTNDTPQIDLALCTRWEMLSTSIYPMKRLQIPQSARLLRFHWSGLQPKPGAHSRSPGLMAPIRTVLRASISGSWVPHRVGEGGSCLLCTGQQRATWQHCVNKGGFDWAALTTEQTVPETKIAFEAIQTALDVDPFAWHAMLPARFFWPHPLPEPRPDLIEERRDEHRQRCSAHMRLAQEMTTAAVRYSERQAAMPDALTLEQPSVEWD